MVQFGLILKNIYCTLFSGTAPVPGAGNTIYTIIGPFFKDSCLVRVGWEARLYPAANAMWYGCCQNGTE